MPANDPVGNLFSNLFPANSRVLLTGGGKQFIERIGATAVREAIYRVMLGENLRNLTEPLGRRRIAQVNGALVAFFTDGFLTIDQFGKRLSELSVAKLLKTKRNDKAEVWIAQWLLGLTGKANQNVLRNDREALSQYVTDFERAIQDAAKHCLQQIGDYRMTLGHYEGKNGRKVEIDWQGIVRLMTAIGAQTLTIRGSDKSMYGKLFEKLILGSVLSLLGFERVDPTRNKRDRGVFWLSDSSDIRESDATLLVAPGKLARFDIGFIGPGNSEISKDKLSRFGAELETGQGTTSSVTFIIVDRLPKTGKTEAAAAKIGAEIVQMVMQYWPRRVAQLLRVRFGYQHAIADMKDKQLRAFLKNQLDRIAVEDFLSGVTVAELETADEDDDDEES